MNPDQIFDSLVRNALDFLDHAIHDFDRAPKYSVIHFCAAVEMLLKARLMREHWSLVVSKKENANLHKFIEGDFISVTLDESRSRLRDIVGQVISDEAFKSFSVLSKHRNKMIHFFNAGLEGDTKAKADIVAEQCRAWFYLHRLLRNNWRDHFDTYLAEITKADVAMKAHGKYLGAKFEALKDELAAKVKDGCSPKNCSVCDYRAALPDDIDNHIETLECLVCDHTEIQVTLDCPHCSEDIEVAGEGFAKCPNCGGAIEPKHIANVLTDHQEAHRAIKDGDDRSKTASCGACEGYHTVVFRETFYFCAACFDISESVEDCEWCNEPNTGDMEDSYFNGCSHCDGHSGHIRDD
jgi:hypothetical protein